MRRSFFYHTEERLIAAGDIIAGKGNTHIRQGGGGVLGK